MRLSTALFALAAAGCSNLAPYTGPTGPPVLDGIERVWPHGIDNKLSRETILLVTNRNYEPLDAVLECSPHEHGHQSRNWMGSRFTLHVPPRTTMSILLHPHDHRCELQTQNPESGLE